MSLFSAREWWTAPRSDEPEEYDTQSMVVANFGQSGGDDVVVTGSLSGVRLWALGPAPRTLRRLERVPAATQSPAQPPTHLTHTPHRPRAARTPADAARLCACCGRHCRSQRAVAAA